MGVQGKGRMKDSPTFLLVILACFVFGLTPNLRFMGCTPKRTLSIWASLELGLKGFSCKETLGVLGIVVDDVRAQHHVAPSLVDENAVPRPPELSSRMRS